MTHTYELRKFEDDGKITVAFKLQTEPKYAKQEANAYAKRHPGLYTLVKVEKIAMYITEKE